MLNKTTIIIDFDSTFVTVEALDQLAKIALKNNPQQKEITTKIEEITKRGMEGKLSFDKSLKQRLSLFQPTKQHIETLVKILKKSVTPSIFRNKQFFKTHSSDIYIISGGFREYIQPIVTPFGITKEHILANTFVFDKKGTVTGFDTKNFLSQAHGKTKQIQALNLKGDIIVIGDGYTDFEIKKHGAAQHFYAFTENIRRESVIKHADVVVGSFDEFLYQHDLPRTLSYPKSKMKVLLLENIDKSSISHFMQQGYDVETVNAALSEKELIEKIPSLSILGIRSKTEITKAVLNHAKRLLAIGAFCIGTNQIDLTSCTKYGIAVFNAPYSNTRSVVELTIAEIIMLYRRVVEKNQKLHEGIWDKSAEGCREVRGKTVGIVGYGNIGAQLSVVAENLGMRVVFYDIGEKLALGNATRCNTLSQLLKQSDVVTIHVDGRKENTNLISEKELLFMKKGAYFINNSRGYIVDIATLARHIKSGKIAGAAVDVFPHEPKTNKDPFTSPLQGLPNVILTPHIGGSTQEAQKNIAIFVSARLTEFIDRGDTTLSVNFPQIQLPTLIKAHRLIHIHKNVPGILAQINRVFSQYHCNIEGQYLKTTEDIGYVITDINKNYNQKIIHALKNIKQTIRMRVLY